MFFKQIPQNNQLKNFSYVIADENKIGAIVDPSEDPDAILKVIEENDIKVTHILITHAHWDHVQSVRKVRETFPDAKTVMYVGSTYEHNIGVGNNETITIGNLKVTCRHTPGHTPYDVCYVVENKLFTGDHLFVGKIGGTQTENDAQHQWKSLHETISLPDDTEVWPGHDFGKTPSSTIKQEKETNPFLLCKKFDEFYHLKNNWAAYKKEHGIK